MEHVFYLIGMLTVAIVAVIVGIKIERELR